MDNETIERLNQHLVFLMLEVILEQDLNSNFNNAHQWDKEVIIDDIDYGVMKLVPLYLQKLKEIGHFSPHEKRFKVLHKYWWLKTLKNLDRLKEVILALSNKGKEVMLIKGIPVLSYYDAPVYRPMADLDILVKKEEVFNCLSILEEMGWKCTDSFFLTNLQKAPSLCLDFKHSIELEHPEERTKMDLHWKVGNYASWELTYHVWSRAQPSDEFQSAKIPELSDLLCMGILHSVDPESKHHYNWIVDIAKLYPHLTREIWESSRNLAISEQKQNWFDYGCFLLNRFGINTPFESKVTEAPIGRLKKKEFGSKFNILRYFWKKTENNLVILSINFPHDQGFQKIYRLISRLAYFKLNRAGKHDLY
jgi:hypothetical protein